MKKVYECSVCGEKFELSKDVDAASLRQEITMHCLAHAADGEVANVLATSYRANYTCVTCGKIVQVGSNGVDALMERIRAHRKECVCTMVIPAEFVTDEEVGAYQSVNMDAGE